MGESVGPKDDRQRRGWMHIACRDVALRDQLRTIPCSLSHVSALDLLDGLVDVVDELERRLHAIDTRSEASHGPVSGM